MLLCSEGSGHVFAAFHHAAALVIQTYNRWHAVPTWTALEGWSNRFVVSNAARFCACSGGKTGNKGLLLHPRLCAQRTRHIAQIPHLVPLVGGKGHDTVIAVKALPGSTWLCHEGLHLHIGELTVRPHEPRLDLKRTRQHLRQLLAALKGAAQDAQTGGFR